MPFAFAASMLWPLEKKTRDALVIFASDTTRILEVMKWEVKPMEDRVMMKRDGISNVLEDFKIRKLCHHDFDNNHTSLTTITIKFIDNNRFYHHILQPYYTNTWHCWD